MFRLKIEAFLTNLQLPLLYTSYYLCKLFLKKSPKIPQWVIGTDEIASNIHNMKKIITPSINVCFFKNFRDNITYDYELNIQNDYLRYIIRFFYGPSLLGYLCNTSSHFYYIWHKGFLCDRRVEFKFLKSINKKIVCQFCGDDIRSLKLLSEYAKKNQIDTIFSYTKGNNSDDYDNYKKYIAEYADKYVDLIFSAKTDQISYLQSPQHYWNYAYDKEKFYKSEDKFTSIKKIKILHAPSNPLVKGTPLVRSAIKKLQVEGYDFEYIELQNKSNQEILNMLKDAHIVLNQFYAFAPGLFGIEAMANHCAVLMSADLNIEPAGCPRADGNNGEAWLITTYWQVYDNLKYLLDKPDQIKYYADNGYNFAYKYYTYEAASTYINKIFKENGIIE